MLKDMNIYFIGGSPCCGKSTISEMLKDEFSFEYYKLDDHLDRHMNIGAKNNLKRMKEYKAMSLDEIWFRDVEVQVEWEFEYQIEALSIIKKELIDNYSENSVITEGAVLLPEFIKENDIDYDKYICIVPTKEFQLEKFSKRVWIKDYLKNCSNVDKAYKNWMDRDIEYAQIVRKQAEELGMNTLIVDGSKTIYENYDYVKKCFNL